VITAILKNEHKTEASSAYLCT